MIETTSGSWGLTAGRKPLESTTAQPLDSSVTRKGALSASPFPTLSTECTASHCSSDPMSSPCAGESGPRSRRTRTRIIGSVAGTGGRNVAASSTSSSVPSPEAGDEGLAVLRHEEPMVIASGIESAPVAWIKNARRDCWPRMECHKHKVRSWVYRQQLPLRWKFHDQTTSPRPARPGRVLIVFIRTARFSPNCEA
jgi:hypothetical protein